MQNTIALSSGESDYYATVQRFSSCARNPTSDGEKDGVNERYEYVVTDLSSSTTHVAVFDDATAATESGIYLLDQRVKTAQPPQGPMRFDASRVPRSYRLLRAPSACAESGDAAYAMGVARNAYSEKLGHRLKWCAEPDTFANHAAEAATNSGRFGKPKTGGPGLLDPSQ